MTVQYSDVLRINDYAATVSGVIKNKQLGIADDARRQIIFRDHDDNYYNWTPDEYASGLYYPAAHNHHTLVSEDRSIDPMVEASSNGELTIYGSGLFEVEDSTSGTLLDVLTLRRLTTGTAGDGIGCSIKFEAEEKYGSINHVANINAYESGEKYIDLVPGGAVTVRTNSGGSTTIGRHDAGNENYVNFPLYGGPQLVGNAKVNQTIPIPITDLANGSTPPDSIVSGNMVGYSYDIGDDSVFVVRLPENYYQSATSDELDINIVYSTNEAYATSSAEVQWQVDWGKYYYGGNTTPGSPASSGSTAGGDENIPALAGAIQRKTITVSGVLQDDSLMSIKVSRIALDDGVDPASDPAILQIYVTYLADALEE